MPAWLALVLKEAAKDPKGFIKKFAGILIGIVFFIILICIITVNMLASLLGHVGVIKVKEDLSVTEIYQTIDQIQKDYLQELRQAEDAIRDKIIEANTYIVQEERKVYDPVEEEYVMKWVDVEKCDVSVVTQTNAFNYAYYFSYINYISDVMWGEKYEMTASNKKDLKLFTRKISVLQLDYDEIYQIDLLDKNALNKMLQHISDLGRIDDKVQSARIENKVMTPRDVADEFFPDQPENQEFMVSFDLFCDFLDFLNIGQGGVDTDTGNDYDEGELGDIIDKIEEDEICLGVPKYYQNRYKNKYGNGTIASSGCAPTSIAMCLSYLKKDSITPVDIVNWTGNRYYVSGQGSSWAIFGACASQWGVGCSAISGTEAIINSLKAGKPVIASMGPGTFTSAGHLIVIKGVTKDGYFIINDPNEGNFNRYKTERFLISTVMSQSKQFWSMG